MSPQASPPEMRQTRRRASQETSATKDPSSSPKVSSKAETARVESPKTASRVTASKGETPKVTTLKVESPKVTSKVESSRFESNKVTSPRVTSPRVGSPKVSSPKFGSPQRSRKASYGMKQTKSMDESGSPSVQKGPLRRQSTDVSLADSEASEYATPPTSPLKKHDTPVVATPDTSVASVDTSVATPVPNSPITWNTNPLYGKDTPTTGTPSSVSSSSPSQSPSTATRSSTRTHSSKPSPRFSPGSLTDSISSQKSSQPRRTLRAMRRSTVDGSSRSTPQSDSSPSPSKTPTTDSGTPTISFKVKSPPTVKRVALNNAPSVFSQQSSNNTNGSGPPSPPIRKDSITKARKASLKVDTENMLYGKKVDNINDSSKKWDRKASFEEEEQIVGRKLSHGNNRSPLVERKGSLDKSPLTQRKSSVDKENNIDILNGNIENTNDLTAPRDGKVSFKVETSVKTADTKYLDGFRIDAPDDTVIKPSKLRESMRKNRQRRAQTAPVNKDEVDKALEDLDRKWSKPERTTLNHLPLADRLAFSKMRRNREQNNNDPNSVFKKPFSTSIAANKVLKSSSVSSQPPPETNTSTTTITPSMTSSDNVTSMTSSDIVTSYPINASSNSKDDSPSITTVLQLTPSPGGSFSQPPSRRSASPIRGLFEKESANQEPVNTISTSTVVLSTLSPNPVESTSTTSTSTFSFPDSTSSVMTAPNRESHTYPPTSPTIPTSLQGEDTPLDISELTVHGKHTSSLKSSRAWASSGRSSSLDEHVSYIASHWFMSSSNKIPVSCYAIRQANHMPKH